MSDPSPLADPFHVLVVDDNRDAADTLALLLEMSVECRVTTAYDGGEAICKATAQRPDAVVLDVAMPRLNGIEAADALRAAYPGNPPLLIALTAYGDIGMDSAAGAPFDAHLVKPVRLDDLLETFDAHRHPLQQRYQGLERRRVPRAGTGDDQPGL